MSAGSGCRSMLRVIGVLLVSLFVLSSCSLDLESGSEIHPVSYAAWTCDVAEVERLVEEEGFDPLERRDDPFRSTHLASALLAFGRRTSGATHEECVATIQFFLDAGADPTLMSDAGSGAPSMVLGGDNLPQVLDLFDQSAENWCVPSSSTNRSVKRSAIQHAAWSETDVETYLGRCPD